MEFDYLANIEELKEEVQSNFDRIITAANKHAPKIDGSSREMS